MADFNSTADSDEIQAQLDCMKLETELTPLWDEAISTVNYREWQTKDALTFLNNMRDWEYAEIRPISNWFTPPLKLQNSRLLTDEQVAVELDNAIQQLYEKKIVLEFTDHLSDRELYDIIAFEILPLEEKRFDKPPAYIHWNMVLNDSAEGMQNWLRYYASDKECEAWAELYGQVPPTKSLPLYPRDLPREPGQE